MRMTRIRLENWRNFSSVDVRLQNRLFIVGANASGKSNFLDAMRFLHELVTPGGGFQKSIERRGGVSSIRNLAARGQSTDVVVDVELGEDTETLWRYRVAFNNQGRAPNPVLVQEKVWRYVDGELRVLLARPNDADRQDEARLTQTLLEQTFANQDFRDIATFFNEIQYTHIVPQLVRDPERYTATELDPFGGDFLEQIAAVRKNSQEARLRRIGDALQLAVPQLKNLTLTRDKRGIPHLEAQYEHWRPRGKWQNENDFSDGTLRLIGLLWALQDGDGPLLLEEPELSLHAAVTRYLPAMIQSIARARKTRYRQILISTHSRDLLDAEGIDGAEVLLLRPAEEGTEVTLAADDEMIRAELLAALPLSESVLSRTAPDNIQQLALFE